MPSGRDSICFVRRRDYGIYKRKIKVKKRSRKKREHRELQLEKEKERITWKKRSRRKLYRYIMGVNARKMHKDFNENARIPFLLFIFLLFFSFFYKLWHTKLFDSNKKAFIFLNLVFHLIFSVLIHNAEGAFNLRFGCAAFIVAALIWSGIEMSNFWRDSSLILSWIFKMFVPP